MSENTSDHDRAITKYIKLQISGDADAVNAAIALLHHLNFINDCVWNCAAYKRGESAIDRTSYQAIETPISPATTRLNSQSTSSLTQPFNPSK